MARDVTWRGSATAPSRKKKGLYLILGLVAVNVAVVVYHGDPRDRLPRPAERAAPARSRAASVVPAKDDAPAPSPRVLAQRLAERARGELGWVFASAADERLWRAGLIHAPAALDALPRELPDTAWAVASLDPTVGLRAPGPVQRVEIVKLKSGQAPAHALASAGISGGEISGALASLAALVDFRRMRPGHQLKARLDETGRLLSLGVAYSVAEEFEARRGTQGWEARRIEIPVETVTSQVAGQVRATLWDAVIGAGEEPALLAEFADIFAWEVDFYRDVRVGDSFRMLVEKRYARGKFLGYGRIIAAEYVNEGQSHLAFAHERSDGSLAYYDEQGGSTRKQLLKTPLQYGRMTSGFGSRRHPILGYDRQHNGVDYGVPTGTPVWSVGDGRVSRAGWHNGFGKLVEITHANGWMSQYAHLSAITVKAGERVSQKQIIGKVGSTGMSTGPHLHYGLKKAGAYVNPAAQKFDRAKSLEGAERAAFLERAGKLVEELQRIHVAHEPTGRVSQEG